jgi:hypothetical protein
MHDVDKWLDDWPAPHKCRQQQQLRAGAAVGALAAREPPSSKHQQARRKPPCLQRQRAARCRKKIERKREIRGTKKA